MSLSHAPLCSALSPPRRSHTPACAGAQTAEQTNEQAQQQPPAPAGDRGADAEGKDTATARSSSPHGAPKSGCSACPPRFPRSTSARSTAFRRTDTTGLQGAVPNLNIVQGRGSSNATNIFIRGIGQPDALQTFDPAVGLYVDDVYLSRIRGNRSTFSTSTASRCCAARRERSTARTPSAARSNLSPASRDRNSAPTAAYRRHPRPVRSKGAVSGRSATRSPSASASIQLEARRLRPRPVLHRRYNDKNTSGGRGAIALHPVVTSASTSPPTIARRRGLTSAGRSTICATCSAYGHPSAAAGPGRL